MKKEIAMEDICLISLEAMNVIEERLKEFGIELTPPLDDEVYLPMHDAIEKVAGYPDYRSHN